MTCHGIHYCWLLVTNATTSFSDFMPTAAGEGRGRARTSASSVLCATRAGRRGREREARTELVDDLAVLEREDGRERGDLERAGNEDGEGEASVVLGGRVESGWPGARTRRGRTHLVLLGDGLERLGVDRDEVDVELLLVGDLGQDRLEHCEVSERRAGHRRVSP